jgi:hypothetical protein
LSAVLSGSINVTENRYSSLPCRTRSQRRSRRLQCPARNRSRVPNRCHPIRPSRRRGLPGESQAAQPKIHVSNAKHRAAITSFRSVAPVCDRGPVRKRRRSQSAATVESLALTPGRLGAWILVSFGLMIGAWDLLPSGKQKPQRWLHSRRPCSFAMVGSPRFHVLKVTAQLPIFFA